MNPIFQFFAFLSERVMGYCRIVVFSKTPVLYLLLLCLASFSFAKLNLEYTGQTLWGLSNIPEDQVDVGLWSLIIAKYQDPELDIPYYLSKIDHWVEVIDSGIQDRSTDAHIVFAANYVLFKKGPWNDYSPMAYDLDDPMGDIIKNRFLPSYLDRRRGNCITMPTLLLAIIERIDPRIPIYAAYAPMHVYCVVQDRATGKKLNVEATNGFDARDAFMIESFRIPQEGIDSGIYMQPLSKKEFLAGLIGTLALYEQGRKNYQKALNLINLTLKLHARSPAALVTKGSILHSLGWDTLVQPLKSKKLKPTPEEQKEIERLDHEGQLYFQKAKKLGWLPETMEDRARYLEIIAKAKKDQVEKE